MEAAMIDVKLLTLLKVHETGNYTRAAEQLSLTQPAVSQHIKQIEKELNTSLFVRSGGKIHQLNVRHFQSDNHLTRKAFAGVCTPTFFSASRPPLNLLHGKTEHPRGSKTCSCAQCHGGAGS